MYKSQGMTSLMRTALAIVYVVQEILPVAPFVQMLESLLVHKTKLIFSLWRKFQTVIALVQLGAVWKKESKVFNNFNSIVYCIIGRILIIQSTVESIFSWTYN